MSGVSEFDIILDNSQQNLSNVPEKILDMSFLRMLYLEGNFIKELPDNFFPKLQKLTWLDLRHNKLTYVPENIANHPNLENLLLSGNQIEVLPNELGLVPNLKVLQIGENPIYYPTRHVIVQGTKAICNYLKRECDKINAISKAEAETILQNLDAEELKILQEETELAVIDSFDRIPLKDDISSTLVVKALSHSQIPDHKITHKVNKNDSKISVRSYYNSNKYIKASTTQTSNHDVILQNALKKEWVDKLKNLLAEQEKILQLERNLETLSGWRSEKKMEPPRSTNLKLPSEVPYATYPEYDMMLKREDLGKQLDRIIGQNNTLPKRDVQKLVDDVVSRLKEIETTYQEENTPRTEIQESGKQIMLIMDIHKKLMQLQQTI